MPIYPKKITITIAFGNGAMQETVHVAELLTHTAQRIRENGFRDLNLKDINGNTVGELKCTGLRD